jgi:hypothetical protein
MLFGRSLNRLLAVAALTAAAAAAQTTTSGTVTRQTTTPVFGLASTETAQINVVNVAKASSGGTAASCTGTISFLNASGTVIGSATPFTVTSGQIFSATLPFNSVGASGIRTEIRGEITVTETTGAMQAPCALTSSLETYDTSTGATHLYHVISNLVAVASARSGFFVP